MQRMHSFMFTCDYAHLMPSPRTVDKQLSGRYAALSPRTNHCGALWAAKV